MNVCVVNPNFYRSSGVTIAIRRICEGSTALPITWFLVDCEYGSEHSLTDYGWIHALPNIRVDTLRLMDSHPLRLINAIFAFKAYLKVHRINVIHVHHRRLAAFFGMLQSFLGVPCVYTGQLTYDHNVAFKFVPMPTATAITESVKHNMEQTTSARNIVVISNPAMTPEVDAVDLASASRRQVICIARLEPVKNHDLLIRAWKSVCDKLSDCDLVLVGEGTLKAQLEGLVTELGIADRVVFAGFHGDVAPLILRSDFMVLPSWREGQGIVTIEGAVLGKATLLTDVDGSRDCVPPDCQLPNKVDPKSVPSMTAALDYWLAHADEVETEGQRFQAYWSRRANPQYIARQYYDVYKSLLKAAG